MTRAAKKLRFKKFLGLKVRRQDTKLVYDPEIREEYLIHDTTPFPLPHHL